MLSLELNLSATLFYDQSRIMETETIFISVSEIKVMTAMHLLKEAGVHAHHINKMDSAHANIFGDIEIIVQKDDEEKARAILKEAEII